MIEPTPMTLGRALREWASTDGHGIRWSAKVPNTLSVIQLHHRPDRRGPEVAVTLHAELVDGEPVIRVDLPESPREVADRSAAPESPGKSALWSTADLPVREPDATCEACGAIGTIGRAVRAHDQYEVEIHRFCFNCWPEQSARYRARWEDEDRRASDALFRGRRSASGSGPEMLFQAATWHSTLQLVRDIQRSMMAPMPPPSRTDLAHMAAEIEKSATELEGEMPHEVETFVRQYRAP